MDFHVIMETFSFHAATATLTTPTENHLQ